MGRREKLIDRFLSIPKDLTYSELTRLMGYFGFNEKQASGSRVFFMNATGIKFRVHKPHKRNTVLEYQIKQAIEVLKRANEL